MRKCTICCVIYALTVLSVFGQTRLTSNSPSLQSYAYKPDPIALCMGEIIDSCFLTTSQDCDNDQFAGWRWLVVDMYNAAPIASAYIEVWLEAAGGNYKLFTSNTYDLPRTRYGMKVPGKDHIQGVLSIRVMNAADNQLADEYEITGPVGFESTDNDYAISLPYFRWETTNSIDADGDGYFSVRQLYINLSGCPDTRNIYFKVSVCKQPVLAGPCDYYTSPDFVVDTYSEIHNVSFGSQERELTHGEYHVSLQAYDASSDQPLMPYYIVETNAKFELPSEDVPVVADFSISNIFIGDEGIDLDGDGYYRSRDLNFTTSVDHGSYNLTGQILQRNSGTEGFTLCKNIPEFTVSCTGTQQKVIVDGLYGPFHDLKIELYHGTTLVAEVLPEVDNDLYHLPFESDQGDNPIKINSVRLINLHDWDGDGIPSFNGEAVDFENFGESQDVYMEVYEILGEGTRLIGTTDVFSIEPGSSSDTTYLRPKWRPGVWVKLYRADNDELEADYWLYPPIPVETQENDLIYELKSWVQTSSVDLDNDGYCSHRQLAIDIDVKPIPRKIKFETSLCRRPILAGPCPYDTSEYYLADSTSTDKYLIDIGGSNHEKDSGTYQIGIITIIDSVTGISTQQWIPVAQEVAMESTLEDVPSSVKFTISNVHMGDGIDLDKDGYYQSRYLNFNIDVSSGMYFLTGEIYERRPAYSNDFPSWPYKTIPEFMLTFEGREQTVIIDSLPGYLHDFKILLYNGTELVAKAIPEYNPELNNQKFESETEDSPFKIDTAYLIRSNDWDGDGIPSSKSFMVKFDTFDDPGPVYMTIEEYRGESSEVIDTTETFQVSPDKPWYVVDVYANSYRRAGIILNLYRASDNSRINSIFATDSTLYMEPQDEDLSYTLKSWVQTDSIDTDGDGYCSFRRLAVDIDVKPIPRKVHLITSLCKRPILVGPCPYVTTENFLADSTSNDKYYLDIGSPNPEKAYGTYSLQFILIDSISGEGMNSTSYGSGMKMEPAEGDNNAYQIADLHFTDETDLDLDNYNRSANLSFTLTCSSEETKTVTARLFSRKSDEVPYLEYYTSQPFDLSASDPHLVNIPVGFPDSQLEHGEYYFVLQIFEGNNRVCEIIPWESAVLWAQKFETSEQDSPYKIHEISYGKSYDWDGDGLFSYRDLLVDFDVYDQPDSFYLKVYYFWEAFNLYTTTPVFELSAEYPRYIVPLDANYHIFFTSKPLVELYRASDNQLIDVVRAENEASLEPQNEDLVYNLSSFHQIDSIDMDGDGYCSYRQFALDIDVKPIPRKVHLEMSMCKKPIMAGPCDYDTTENFLADSTSLDMFLFEVGGSNPEKSHSIYQLGIISIVDSMIGDNAMNWIPMEENLKMEAASEDVPVTTEFTVSDIHMGDEGIDLDGDGYYRSRDLNFMVSVNNGSYDLTGKILQKRSSVNMGFAVCENIPEFTVSTTGTDQKVIIDQLEGPLHDLKIALYNGNNLVAEVLPEDDEDLYNQPFETAVDDSPVKVDSIRLINLCDWDGDGKPSFNAEVVDFENLGEAQDVYMEVHEILGEGTRLLGTTDVFTIEPGISSDTTYFRPIWRPGVRIKLYRADNDELLADYWLYPLIPVETQENDLIYELSSWEQTDSIDSDGDGYCSYRQFALNVGVKPIPRKVHLEMSICKKPILAGPCIYDTTENFLADSSSLDIFLFEIGGSNPEQSHGIYQLGIISIVDSIIGDNTMNWIPMEEDLKMEAASEDVLACTLSEMKEQRTGVDADGDQYYSKQELHFRVEVNSGVHTMYAKVMKKKSEAGVYENYYTTDTFSVSAGVPKEISVCLGQPNDPLDHGQYDLLLEVYRQTGDQLMASIGAESDQDYKALQMEDGLEDNPTTIIETGLHGILIYPNPFNGSLTVDAKASNMISPATIDLYNANGELIKLLYRGNMAGQTFMFDLNTLSPGVYIVKIRTDNAINMFKLIKR